MSGIGHNRGPSMDRGAGWRRFAWHKARAELLPVLPVEMVRMRVRRARELGLDYKTYAGVRASTGRDLVAFLFSSNALWIERDRIAPARVAKLEALRRTGRIVLVHPPGTPEAVLSLNAGALDGAGSAPTILDTWPELRDRVTAPIGALPRDGILVIGATHLERDWCAAGRLAGYLDAERYFAP
ncbi:hypothetical protein [Ovoidimarina sediminis]|uniref:hypothetical protein n=1 Tax=Ovoidimarina sediminis TaxID=3079856 RepID=UPI002906D6C6|nr:hypothetical protein [Rhodophyticola sp. MJ-SS7]MDU8943440.1 hypothetical protein [Rhodophyticola sp. MJ-SS7]